MSLVSIIIPVRNGEKYIGETLKGIASQEVKDIELIVVDDGSTDSTAGIVREAGCKLVSHADSRGPVVAKNSGLRVATGEFVMFHDADDVMRPGALGRLIDELSSDNSISAVAAMVKDFFSPDLNEEQKRGVLPKPEPFHGLFTGAILIRRQVFDVIGLFPEHLRAGEILYWQSKMDENGFRVKKLDFVSTDRRIHASNFGRTDSKLEYRDYAAILRMRMKK